MDKDLSVYGTLNGKYALVYAEQDGEDVTSSLNAGVGTHIELIIGYKFRFTKPDLEVKGVYDEEDGDLTLYVIGEDDGREYVIAEGKVEGGRISVFMEPMSTELIFEKC